MATIPITCGCRSTLRIDRENKIVSSLSKLLGVEFPDSKIWFDGTDDPQGHNTGQYRLVCDIVEIDDGVMTKSLYVEDETGSVRFELNIDTGVTDNSLHNPIAISSEDLPKELLSLIREHCLIELEEHPLIREMDTNIEWKLF